MAENSVQTKAELGTDPKTAQVIEELTAAYWMELETVQNYLANSTNLDGVRAAEIKESLSGDIGTELEHAQQLAGRIHVLGGMVPGSENFTVGQQTLQPPEDSADVVSVIRGVIDAENMAIEQYDRIIKLTDGFDFATQDLCIDLLRDEQEHRREFLGFLAEYERGA